MDIATSQEGVVILSKQDVVVGLIRKDIKTRKNVFYSCSEMSIGELAALFNKKEPNITPKKNDE